MVTDRQAKSRRRARELAHRRNSDVEVTLLWRKHDNLLTLRLVELGTGVEFELSIPPENALDAFHHPYAYLTTHSVEPLELLAA